MLHAPLLMLEFNANNEGCNPPLSSPCLSAGRLMGEALHLLLDGVHAGAGAGAGGRRRGGRLRAAAAVTPRQYPLCSPLLTPHITRPFISVFSVTLHWNKCSKSDDQISSAWIFYLLILYI